MHVGSLIEIYTTMFGWSLYDTFYHILSMTGFLYYPFLMSIYKNWKEPVMSQDDKPASIISQRRMTFSIISMILVFMVAIVPFKQLVVSQIHYRYACTDPNSGATIVKQTATGGATGTTYDSNLNASSAVRIPGLWWLVLNVSSGINAAATTSFTCFEDIQGLDRQLRNLTIKDQPLRKEYSRFANECFLPAVAKYKLALQGGQYHNYVIQQLKSFFGPQGTANRYDMTDPYYIGSHFYLRTPGFYNWDNFSQANCTKTVSGCSLQASSPVSGWTYNPARDKNYSKKDIQDHVPGEPDCDEWWTGLGNKSIGLKDKLLNNIQASKITILNWDSLPGTTFWQKAQSEFANINARIHSTFLGDHQLLEDLVIKRYAALDPPIFITQAGDYVNTAPKAGTAVVINTDTALVAGAGAATVAATSEVTFPAVIIGAGKTTINLAAKLSDFYVDMFVVKRAAPMMQALVLMMIYAFMIFYFVMSEYEIDSIITMIFLVLGIRFFTTLWVLADYIDARLYTAMFPDMSMIGSVFTQGINRFILDVVTTTLYIVIPLVFLSIMNMAGQNVSRMGNHGSQLSLTGNKRSAVSSNMRV